jgi:hypothetical protein
MSDEDESKSVKGEASTETSVNPFDEYGKSLEKFLTHAEKSLDSKSFKTVYDLLQQEGGVELLGEIMERVDRGEWDVPAPKKRLNWKLTFFFELLGPAVIVFVVSYYLGSIPATEEKYSWIRMCGFYAPYLLVFVFFSFKAIQRDEGRWTPEYIIQNNLRRTYMTMSHGLLWSLGVGTIIWLLFGWRF